MAVDRDTTPVPTAVDRRATSCAFTDAALGKSCSTIVLSGITVPAGTTLDMTGLNRGTQVSKPRLILARMLTDLKLSSKEPPPSATLSLSGPLFSVSGTDITATGSAGHVLDGGRARWWDGKGSNAGVTKPKFFYAHSLTTSSITDLNIKEYACANLLH